MRRPTRVELANLITNLEELGRVIPGDKLSVTSDRFSVQRKGFFSQSVARTFSRNSASAYYRPVFRLFQIAVVDRLWNGVPQPWAQIDAAFAGLGNLRQTYALELEEAEGKNKPAAVLAEKRQKVRFLDRLIANVTPLVKSRRNVNPEMFWAAAPRGYGRSRNMRMTNIIKQKLYLTRRFAETRADEIRVPFDTRADFSANVLPDLNNDNLFRNSDRFEVKKVNISHAFLVDAIQRQMTLNVKGCLPFNIHQVGKDQAILYYLHVLHGDVNMLEELSLWCNQGTLGSAMSAVIFENPVLGGAGHNFLTASGIAFSPGPGSPETKFNLFEVRFRKTFGFDQKLHDEVAEASIHVSITTDTTNFRSSVGYYAANQDDDNEIGEPGLNARCPISLVNLEFDFVILRMGPNSFAYEIMNDQVMFETCADDPARETPAWMIQMEMAVA